MTTRHAEQRHINHFSDAPDEARDVGREAGAILKDIQSLARSEGRLARAEAEATARSILFGAVALLVALLLVNSFVILLFATIVLALDTTLPIWLAALLTTVVVAAMTAVAAFIGVSALRNASILPRRTLRSIKEDIRWAGTQIQSLAK